MTPQPSLESERKTRKKRIDPRLKQWGWDIVPFNPSKPLSGYRHHAIEEFPTANGPADYALVVDGKPWSAWKLAPTLGDRIERPDT